MDFSSKNSICKRFALINQWSFCVWLLYGNLRITSGGEEGVFGSDTTRPGDDIGNLGIDATIVGDEAIILGDEVIMHGDDATISGDDTTISGDDATKPGDDTTTSGDETSMPSDDTTIPVIPGQDTPMPIDGTTSITHGDDTNNLGEEYTLGSKYTPASSCKAIPSHLSPDNVVVKDPSLDKSTVDDPWPIIVLEGDDSTSNDVSEDAKVTVCEDLWSVADQSVYDELRFNGLVLYMWWTSESIKSLLSSLGILFSNSYLECKILNCKQYGISPN